MSAPGPKKTPRRRRRLFPQTARDLVEPLLAPHIRQRGFGEVQILTRWAEIVGAKLAAHSRPVSIQAARPQASGERKGGGEKGRTLIVSVSPAYATDLHYRHPQILERIATYCGAKVVTQLQILQTHPAQNPAHAALPAPIALPAQAASPAPAAEPLPAPSDDPLADALASLARTMAKTLQEPRRMS